MIKKIIPIIALLGSSALIVGISIKPETTEKKDMFIADINNFSEDLNNYVETSAGVQSTMNKYMLNLTNEDLDDLNNIEQLENVEKETDADNLSNPDAVDDIETIIDKEKDTISEINTLYSLSEDVEESCEDFCSLKENISNAIIETQNLINKVQQQEIELNDKQRLLITEQAQQLKNLGRQLSNVTTELSFNMSDLSTIMATNDEDLNKISMKYLIMLDNLVNGNEMLQSSLTSLNLINQMFNMNPANTPGNNYGRVLYGFQQNNEPPIIKEFHLDENQKWVQQPTEENEDNESESNNTENKKTNIDTYQDNKLTSNIDTYYNTNTPRNIDSFFNTALLNNEFMYGNGYGYNGMPYGYNSPLINYTNGVNNATNTQYNEIKEQPKPNKKNKKRLELKKNIDTFKDENEPHIKTKLGNIKSSITNFFSKFKKSDLNDKIDNPISRQTINEDNN